MLILIRFSESLNLLLILPLLDVHVFKILGQKFLDFINTLLHLRQLMCTLLVQFERLRILLHEAAHARGCASWTFILINVKQA